MTIQLILEYCREEVCLKTCLIQVSNFYLFYYYIFIIAKLRPYCKHMRNKSKKRICRNICIYVIPVSQTRRLNLLTIARAVLVHRILMDRPIFRL